MALAVTHPKVLPGPDDSDPDTVSPSDWNAGHDLSMASGKVLGRGTAGDGAVEELTPTNTGTIAWDFSVPGQLRASVIPSYLTGNQVVTLSGDATGSGATSIGVTLASVGTAGTYNSVTTDAKGRVVAGSNVAYLTENQTITVSGDASGSGTTSISLTLATVPVGKGGTGATTFTTGGLLIGNGTGAVSASSDLTFASNLLAVNGDVQLTRNSTDTTSRVLSIRKSRGTSGSPTAVVNNDTVAQIEARGYIGATSTYRRGGYARWIVDTTYGTIADATGRLPLKFQMYRLSAGTEYEAVNIGHEVRVFSGAAEITNGDGGVMAFTSGSGNGTGAGGTVAFVGGDGGLTSGPGGGFSAFGGGSYGASTGGGCFFGGGPAYDTGDGGIINFAGGDAFSSGVGGNILLAGGSGGGGNGKVTLATTLGLGNLPGIEVGDDGASAAIGFFGATLVPQQSLAADATNLATAITLVNDIKAKLLAYGLAV